PPAWAGAQPTIPRILPAGLVTGLAAMSSSSPRPGLPIRDSVRPPAGSPYDACDSGRPGSGSGGAGGASPTAALLTVGPHPTRSRRHVLRMLDPNSMVLLPPRTEEEAGGPAHPVRSPVSWLGIDGALARHPMAPVPLGTLGSLLVDQLGQDYRRYRW